MACMFRLGVHGLGFTGLGFRASQEGLQNHVGDGHLLSGLSQRVGEARHQKRAEPCLALV